MTLDVLLSALGPQAVQAGCDANRSYLTDWTSRKPVVPLAVVRPGSTEEVSKALAICNEHGVPVVPQGGRTGLVGGAQPIENGVVISMDRMTAVEEISLGARTARVQSGVTLNQLQDAAHEHGLFFPVDISSRSSCQIGGMISTNAGGVRVFRDGMMRNNVLGLEVVLPDGRILSAMNGFLKNNTGYDLKQMFIGAEGTLGIVTGAVLRLRPVMPVKVTALLRVEELTRALQVLEVLEARLSGLAVCEIMWPGYYNFASGFRGFDPLPGSDGPTLLIEVEGAEETTVRAQVQRTIEVLFERELVLDGTISQSGRQTEEFWMLRDSSQMLYQAFGSVVTVDVSLYPDGIDDMVDTLNSRLTAMSPRLRCLWFGHLGDMNLHISVVDATGAAMAPELYHQIEECIFSAVIAHGGSISAEHGMGAYKAHQMPRIRSTEEQALSRALRDSFDPKGIMNPGRLF